jgi:hypothetical protein
MQWSSTVERPCSSVATKYIPCTWYYMPNLKQLFHTFRLLSVSHRILFSFLLSCISKSEAMHDLILPLAHNTICNKWCKPWHAMTTFYLLKIAIQNSIQYFKINSSHLPQNFCIDIPCLPKNKLFFSIHWLFTAIKVSNAIKMEECLSQPSMSLYVVLLHYFHINHFHPIGSELFFCCFN